LFERLSSQKPIGSFDAEGSCRIPIRSRITMQRIKFFKEEYGVIGTEVFVACIALLRLLWSKFFLMS
jgi:hypothetical protein